MQGILHAVGAVDNGSYTTTFAPYIIYDTAPSNQPYYLLSSQSPYVTQQSPALGAPWGEPAISDTACHVVSVGDGTVELNVLMLLEGNIWHSHSPIGQPWQPFGHVHGPNNEGVGPFSKISCTALGNQLKVAGLIEGNIWFGTRSIDGAWSEFSHVHGPNNEGYGPIKELSIAAVGDALHFVCVCGDTVWHEICYSNGTWSGFAQPVINWSLADGGWPVLIAAAGMSNGDLHVVVTRDDENDVWHNIRYADGSWSGFNSVGGPSGFKAIGCTSDGSSLALFATQDPTCVSWDYSDGFTTTNTIYGTVRDPSGAWSGYGADGNTPPFNSYGTRRLNLDNGFVTFGEFISVTWSP